MRLKPLEERIGLAVAPHVPELSPTIYQGDADEYCTWNASEIPQAFGDGRAHRIKYMVQVHWFLPLGRRPYAKKLALRRALAGTAGFTAPAITDASDKEGQHYVFEFEAMGGMY